MRNGSVVFRVIEKRTTQVQAKPKISVSNGKTKATVTLNVHIASTTSGLARPSANRTPKGRVSRAS